MSESHQKARNPVRGLRERWRDESLATVWIRPGDWYHPAVEALVEAVADGRPVDGPAERLGAARAAVGAGIAETLDDVTVLYTVASLPIPPHVMRAVAVGWVAESERVPLQVTAHDPATGLPTGEYLAERLRETYGAAQRDGTDVTTTHCLLMLDVGIDDLDTWQRLARSAAIGRTLHQVFGEGHPMAAITDATYAVLCERGRATADMGQALRRVVEHNAEVLGLTAEVRRPTRVWLERLPDRHDAALMLLTHLGR
ncbi:hypothetical protein [Myceligenerans xiligouense]|uniref:GGDEF domain-containing protein n=1 Tax=Myceligenerans xiligouense TaxID=253184 RepID=A0A3N4YJS1_9MICO|nr:hypothetical protein [Myceligenerans xiligouense]RPF19656.1 hypothetical protein EDD34_0214 [Myceligenerans xiligouense]